MQPRICAQSALLSLPPICPLSCSSLSSRLEPSHTPSYGAVSGLWTGAGLGPLGSTPRLALTGSQGEARTIIPWPRSHSVLNQPVLFCPFLWGGAGNRDEDRAWMEPEALCCYNLHVTAAHRVHSMQRPGRGGLGVMGVVGCAHHKPPKGLKGLTWKGKPATFTEALFKFGHNQV